MKRFGDKKFKYLRFEEYVCLRSGTSEASCDKHNSWSLASYGRAVL